MAIDTPRIYFDRPSVQRHGLPALAQLSQRMAEIDQSLHMVGVQGQCLPVARYGLIAPSHGYQNAPQIAEYRNVSGPQSERQAVTGSRVGKFCELQERVAQIILRLDVRGTVLQRLLIEWHRLARASQREQRVRHLEQAVRIMRRQRQRAAKTFQREGPLSLIVQGGPEIAVGFDIKRHQLRGFAQRRQCVLTLPKLRDTEDLPEHPCTGIGLQQRAGAVFRLAQALLVDQRHQRADVIGA